MSSLTGAREGFLFRTADFLLDCRRTGKPVVELPPELCPITDEEAFFVQDAMMQAYGTVGGWKIGARTPDGEPFFAPMPGDWMGLDGALFRGPMHRLDGVEAEIAFRLAADLPLRSIPYTRDEVGAAIGTCAPAIEIIESAFIDPLAVPRESMLADMQMHGGFVAGPAVPQWREIDWSNEGVSLIIDGSVRVEKVGSNPGGVDFLRLLTFLANEGAARTGGLSAGQWITTGSWTGLSFAEPGSEVEAVFEHAGRTVLQFASRQIG